MKIWFRMAETLSDIFERMLQKQKVLVEKYHVLENKIDEINGEKNELENALMKHKAEIERLQMENVYLKIAKAVAPDRETLDKGHELISKLVRNIDKCIGQLGD